MEQQVIFRSRQREYRSPVGAVSETCAVSLRLRLSRRVGAVSVTAVVICDADNTRSEYPLQWCALRGAYDCYEGELPCRDPGLYWYFFRIEGAEGTTYAGKDGREAVLTKDPAAWQLSVYADAYDTPEWIRGGIYYHIFVDRFFRAGDTPVREDAVLHEQWGDMPVYLPNEEGEIVNNDFFGGNLRGIREKLPYLQSLGVTCLYLSPIFTAYSNHKYDTGDYTVIDPMFGTEEDFMQLCCDARRMGMHVILDGVFNHTGSDSVYFNKNGRYKSVGAYQSTESPYYSWYRFEDYPDVYQSWWGIKTLPQVEESDPSFRAFICGKDGVVRRWLRAGASGWRLDVADELPDAFLEELCCAAREEKKDALIIGEVWEDASNKIAYDARRHYFEGKQLDGVMNYPLRTAILRFVLEHNAQQLAETLEWLCENYPMQTVHCLMNALGTHDTPRALTVLAGQALPSTRPEQAKVTLTKEQYDEASARLRHAVFLQMFLPGVPCVYYGDEAGMQGCADPFNRGCYPWGREDAELLTWYRKLGEIRRGISLLQDGAYTTLKAENGCFLFARSGPCGRLVAGVNLSDKDVAITFDVPYADLLCGGEKQSFLWKAGESAAYYTAAPQPVSDGLYK